MKNIYSYLLLLVSVAGMAQIPNGYYNSATGTGYTLKNQLHNKIKNHNTIQYTPGLWNLYPSTDKKPNGKVWDIYSNCDFTFGPVSNGGNQDNGTGGNVECQLYNREHTFPKSWFNDATPMYSDAFHVMPTDKKINGLRGNMAYGKVAANATPISSNGCKIGNNVAPDGPALIVFEPADEYKGDIARTYFYMATCYQDVVSGWKNNNPNGAAFLDGSSDRVYQQWSLDLLYSWHVADPVSAKEIARNNAVYAVQNNRNPFIDHPEYVFSIWGQALSNPEYILLNNIAVYPNPSNDHKINIQSDVQIDGIDLINLNGQLLQQIKKPVLQDRTYTVENLPSGFYLMKITSDKQTVTKKVIIN